MKTATVKMASRVEALANQQAMRLRELRRYLHQRPEVSGSEFQTTSFLCEVLRDEGHQPVVARDGRGLWLDIGRGGDRRLAIRADIDALPIQTQSQHSYASRVDNCMHACGHDAHAAMAFGAIQILSELVAEGEPVCVRFLFQPEEETSRGGLHMIRSGALQGIAAAVSIHVDPSRPVGTVGTRPGIFTAGCDTFSLTIEGQGGHGARPHLTGDLVGAAAQWITDTYRRIPRSIDSRDAVVVNVGSFHAGSAPNVIPFQAHLAGTVRSLSPTGGEIARQKLRDISSAVELTHGCQFKLEFDQHTPPLINDPEMSQLLKESADDYLGEPKVHAIERPSLGAEDFAFIAQEVPSAMFRLGVAGIDVGSEPLHTPKFDIDESALPIGAGVLALAALRWASRGAR